MGIEIDGLGAVISGIEKTANTAKIQSGLKKACLVVEEAARKKAPKDSGALRRSITSEVHGTTGTVFTPLEYAPYMEFGTGKFAESGGRSDVPWRYQDDEGNWHTTSGNKPQPFMRPALQESRGKVLDAMREAME